MNQRTTTGRVVVVGAGVAGLSAAMHLAGTGHAVTVVERSLQPGGKADVLKRGGYTFDAGPTVLTMPGLVEEAFAALGENMADRLELLTVAPAYRAHYHDGSTLDLHTDVGAMAQHIAEVCGGAEAAGYLRFVGFLRRLYSAEFSHFINRGVNGVLELPLRRLAELVSLGAFRNMEAKVRQFLRDERTIRLFSFQALYAGIAPHQARALYSVISYMDAIAGVYVPKGGMHALPAAMARAAEDHGVTFRYGTTVDQVEISSHGRARAVITAEGGRIPADAVVLTADPAIALPDLVGRSPRRLARLRYSPSCYLLLAGAAADHGTGDDLAHHNIHFGSSWRTGFDEIIDQGRLMSDPSFLVSTPSVSDPGLAPAGHHSHYVLVPTPNLLRGRQDWSRLAPRYRDEVLSTLHRHGYHSLARDPQFEHVRTPEDWQRLGCPAGTPFSAAHTFWQTGPFRTSGTVGENIFLAGAGTHPGVGVPMALISGRIAAERIRGASRVRRFPAPR